MKKQPELTPWFPGKVKPVRAGVYERSVLYGTGYWHFDGNVWLFGGAGDPKYAVAAGSPAPEQNLKWRGLTSDPKAAA